MAAKAEPRHCPNCGHGFVPWNVWLITRWSSIQCPKCHMRLNRRIDAQMFWIGGLGVGAYVLLSLLIPTVGLNWRIAVVGLALLVVVGTVDALTVTLAPAGEWRGLRGYGVRARSGADVEPTVDGGAA